jgi:hypothetical protein
MLTWRTDCSEMEDSLRCTGLTATVATIGGGVLYGAEQFSFSTWPHTLLHLVGMPTALVFGSLAAFSAAVSTRCWWKQRSAARRGSGPDI